MKLVEKPTAGRKQHRKLSAAVHANKIGEWKKQLISRATEVFGGAGLTKPIDLDPLHATIGQLALENDCSERALVKAGRFACFVSARR